MKLNPHARALCFTVIGAFTLATASAETRVWVDDQGREVRATFSGVTVDGQSVQLKIENGSTVSFPLARLSQACQAYAKEMAETKPAAVTATTKAYPAYNFDSPWPELIGFREDPEVETIREDPDTNDFVYESMNFRYVSDVRLSRSVVRGFAVLFEATHAYCKAMPIGMGEGVRTDGKYLIKLFETKEDYVKAGAPSGSTGVFMGGENLIMVPLESLGVRKVGSGYMFDRSESNRTLSHEITHQLTPTPYFGQGEFNSWFVEGIAEYVCTTPYRSGQYNTRNGRRAAVDYATGFSRDDNRGRNIGTEVEMKSLESFMDMPYGQFVASNGNFNYAVGLLLTYYFIHIDGEGDAAIFKTYKRALLDGKGKDEATKVLLNGRTFEQLERDVESGWRRYGVRFKFGE